MNDNANQKKIRESLKVNKTQVIKNFENVKINLKVFENENN